MYPVSRGPFDLLGKSSDFSRKVEGTSAGRVLFVIEPFDNSNQKSFSSAQSNITILSPDFSDSPSFGFGNQI